MPWYLQSTKDHDTHRGTLSRVGPIQQTEDVVYFYSAEVPKDAEGISDPMLPKG